MIIGITGKKQSGYNMGQPFSDSGNAKEE